jgi:hypothetical protein
LLIENKYLLLFTKFYDTAKKNENTPTNLVMIQATPFQVLFVLNYILKN